MGHYDDFYEFYKDKSIPTLNDSYLPKPINFKKKITRVETKIEPLTNNEWRCICSAEEFAEWLNGLIDYCFGIGYICTSDIKKYDKVTDDPEKWLKEKHSE